MMQVKQLIDKEIYLSIKYIKSVLWTVAKRLSYIEEARCLKVNLFLRTTTHSWFLCINPLALDMDI